MPVDLTAIRALLASVAGFTTGRGVDDGSDGCAPRVHRSRWWADCRSAVGTAPGYVPGGPVMLAAPRPAPRADGGGGGDRDPRRVEAGRRAMVVGVWRAAGRRW